MYGQKNKNRTSALPGTGTVLDQSGRDQCDGRRDHDRDHRPDQPVDDRLLQTRGQQRELERAETRELDPVGARAVRLASSVTTSGTTITTSARIVAPAARGADQAAPRVWNDGDLSPVLWVRES